MADTLGGGCLSQAVVRGRWGLGCEQEVRNADFIHTQDQGVKIHTAISKFVLHFACVCSAVEMVDLVNKQC